MRSFTTAFLKWKFHQMLWVAVDPTDTDDRWIIQPSAACFPEYKYELVHASNGSRPLLIDRSDNPIQLGWCAVAKKIKATSLRLSRLHYLMKEGQVQKLQDFLSSLAFPIPEGASDEEADMARNPSPTESLECQTREQVV